MRSRSLGATIAVAVSLAACSSTTTRLTPPPTARPTVRPTATPAATATPTPFATATPTPGATATPTPGVTPTPVATATPTATPTAQPQVVHVGFTHAMTTDPHFGEIAFYAPNAGPAAIVSVTAGSRIVFFNDGTGVPHTASGLGSSGFPASFDNTSGTTPTGTTIDGGTTWTSGSLNPGQTSAPFVVGPAGVYYFGCFYHYIGVPSMRDVIVSN